MKQQFLTPEIKIYKGHEIRTTPNGTHSSSLIYKDGEVKSATFSAPGEPKNSIEKAQEKIDKYL